MNIRRPLYYGAAACAGAILIHYYFGTKSAILVWIALTGIALCCRRACKGRRVLFLITIIYTCSLFSMVSYEHRLAADPILLYLDRSAEMTGVIKGITADTDAKGEEILKLQVELLQIDGEKADSRLLVRIPAGAAVASENAGTDSSGTLSYTALQKCPPGSLIRFFGTPKEPEGRRNPNCFDYQLYLKTFGIQATVRAEHLTLLEEHPGGVRRISAGLFLLREHYLQRVREHAGAETSAMLRAILFGEKEQLSDDVQELFRRNGTAHILAVSGLHVGMIYAAMTVLWDLLSRLCPAMFGVRRGRRFFVCTAVFFSGYVFLAGYAPSVVRAVCMILLHAFAVMTGRRYDLGSAAFAVVIMELLLRPYMLFQMGFQMSFLAILTLSLVCPYIRQVYDGVLVGSIAVQIGLGPYILYQFNTLSLIAVFVNMPVIALAGILVPGGMLGMMLPSATGGIGDWLLSPLSRFCDQGLACLCRVLVRMNEIACLDHITSMTVASPPIWIIASFYLGLFVFASEEGRLRILRGRRQVTVLLIACVLLAAVLFGHAADDGFRRKEMVFVDVGQGDCMHLRSGGRNFLIDGGGSTDYEVGTKTLRPYLLKNGVSHIDGAFVTHLHTDHYQGICELAKAGMIRRIYVYEANRLQLDQICEETGLDENAVIFLRQGQTVHLEGKKQGIWHGWRQEAEEADRIQVLWPPQKTDADYAQLIAEKENENASSLILRVTLDGVSMLATGDLGEEGEQQLLQIYGNNDNGSPTDKKKTTVLVPAGGLQTDILKVGHHGSKTSTSELFLDAVRPDLAMIQVGKNNLYGHPTPEVLDRLARRSIPVYRNDLQGAVGLELHRGSIRIRTVREASMP